MAATIPELKTTTNPDVELRRNCIEWAIRLNPKDAGDLISKAAGIYGWVMTNGN